jgi:hypothetical protein
MKNFLLVLTLSTLILPLGSPAGAATVFLEPETMDVQIGQDFTLTLYIDFPSEDNEDSGGIYAAGGGLRFDPTIIKYDSYLLNDTFWDSSYTITKIESDFFSIGTEVIDAEDEYGQIKIADVIFTALKIGTTQVELFDPDVVKGGEDFFDWNSADSFDDSVEFRNASVNVVPIPCAVWLLGSGLVGLVGLKRRKKA